MTITKTAFFPVHLLSDHATNGAVGLFGGRPIRTEADGTFSNETLETLSKAGVSTVAIMEMQRVTQNNPLAHGAMLTVPKAEGMARAAAEWASTAATTSDPAKPAIDTAAIYQARRGEFS